MPPLRLGRPASTSSTFGDDRSDDRRRMVDEQLRGIRDPRVLAAMATVPRHLFVPEILRHLAYEDSPLPIGHGQTISQPRMVAIMLEAAALKGDERVLEVGAGSGYQAALLSLLVREVFTVEIIPELVDMARDNLARGGIHGVEVLLADGSMGWPGAAPYDAIIVAAGARNIPHALLDQLAMGGRLLIPVGPQRLQTLMRIKRGSDGLTTEDLEGCAFVPLVSGDGTTMH